MLNDNDTQQDSQSWASLTKELPPPESFYIGSSSPDGGSGIRSMIVSDPSIQIPHVKKKCCGPLAKPRNHRPQKHPEMTPFVTQHQLMRLFVVKLILSYEKNVKQGQNFSKIKVCLKSNFDINSMSS